jgi:hypothetical protein
MEEDELENHLARLIDDPYNSYGHAAAAACFFNRAVEQGCDISAQIEALKVAFLEHTQLAVMVPIADALTLHFLKRDELRNLANLLENKRFFQYILDSLRKLENSKVDISAAIPCLIQAGGGSPIFIPFIKSDVRRLKPVLEAMLKLKSARAGIPGLLFDYLLDGRKDIGEVMPILVSLFSRGDIKLRESIANTLRVAAEQGTGFQLVAAKMEKFLGVENETVQTRVAYALSWFYARESQWEHVDRLLAHVSRHVRFGVIWALSVTVNSQQKDLPELFSRFARGLLDEVGSTRNFALSGLKKAESRGKNILSDRPTFEFLATRIDDQMIGPTIMEYLYSCCAHEHPLASLIIESIKSIKQGSDALLLQGMLRSCREIEAGTHVPACIICAQLPRYKSYNYESDVPEELHKLIQVARTDLKKCPVCNTHYIHTHHEEFPSWTEGMGVETEIVIQRLCPTELRNHLKNEELDAFNLTYDRSVEQFKQNLNHPHAFVREESAWALTLHYLKQHRHEELASLLRHPLDSVRINAARTIQDAAKEGLDVAPWGEGLFAALSDQSESMRGSAAAILAQWYFRTGQLEKVDVLLTFADACVKQAVVFQISRAAHDGVEIGRFVQTLRRYLSHSDESVRRHARWALENEPKGVQSEAIEAFIEKFTDPRLENRQEALSALRSAADQGANVSDVLPQLVGALKVADLRWHAMKVLHVALAKGSDISSATPEIIKILADKKISMHKDDFILLLGSMEQHDLDISAAIPALARTALDDRHKGSALSVLLRLAQKGVDLGKGLRNLRKAMTDHDAYYRQETTKVLTTEFINKKDWKAVAGFLRHTRNDIRAVAAERLGEVAPADFEARMIPLLVENLLPSSREYAYRSYCTSLALIALARRDRFVAQQIMDEIRKSKINVGRKVCKEVVEACRKVIS